MIVGYNKGYRSRPEAQTPIRKKGVCRVKRPATLPPHSEPDAIIRPDWARGLLTIQARATVKDSAAGASRDMHRSASALSQGFLTVTKQRR